MKTSIYFVPVALAILTLTGCGNENDAPEKISGSELPSFTATISGAQTRAFDQDWEEADEIGISGCNRSNICYHTADGDGNFKVKASGDQIYFQDDDEAEFIATYPWSELSEGSVSVNADTRVQTNQKNFDFLWAKAKGKKDTPDVRFEFSHKMTKVSFTVKPGNGMSYAQAKTARLFLEGHCHTGSFNITDGSTAVNDERGAWEFTDFAQFDDNAQNLTFSLILFPQELEKPLELTALIELPENKTYTLRASVDFTKANALKDGANAKNEWVPGRQYNMSMTLHKTDIVVGECSIKPWTPVEGDEITVD